MSRAVAQQPPSGREYLTMPQARIPAQAQTARTKMVVESDVPGWKAAPIKAEDTAGSRVLAQAAAKGFKYKLIAVRESGKVGEQIETSFQLFQERPVGPDSAFISPVGKPLTFLNGDAPAQAFVSQMQRHLENPPLTIRSRVRNLSVQSVDCERFPELYTQMRAAERSGQTVQLVGQRKQGGKTLLEFGVFDQRSAKPLSSPILTDNDNVSEWAERLRAGLSEANPLPPNSEQIPKRKTPPENKGPSQELQKAKAPTSSPGSKEEIERLVKDYPGTTEAFRRGVRKTLERVPQKVLQALIAKGYSIDVKRNISQDRTDLRAPPSDIVGESWDMATGLHESGPKNRITINEMYLTTEKTWKRSTCYPICLFHEVGHAFDGLHDYSKKQGFKNLYKTDTADIAKKGVEEEVSYYLPSSWPANESWRGPGEAFAEAFSILLAGPSHHNNKTFRSHFPNVLSRVRDDMKEYGG